MPSTGTLRNTLSQLRAEEQSKHVLAEKLLHEADTHATNGDDARAAMDRNSAARYKEDAERAAASASSIELQIQAQEQKAKEIDRQITELNKNHEKTLKELQDEKARLIA